MASCIAFALAALSLVGTAAGAACPGKTNVAELVKLAPTCLETCAVACEPFDQLLGALKAGKKDQPYLTGIACKYTTELLCVAKTENAQACGPLINEVVKSGVSLPSTEAGAKAACAASATVPAASIAALAVMAAVASVSLA
mmetsp:Transcript_48718/g.113215  ORF Transcript_48718/g.113215 Transcript_48718/m.113215 type:complete len:142 (+) Transcript_48718:85-510(+)